MKHETIYLASQSPRRQDILRKMKIPYIVIRSSYHEKTIQGISPDELTMRHAYGKARKADVPSKACWILGADTIVWLENRILGKPTNYQEAFDMLQLLSGRKHEVYTGLVLLDYVDKRLLAGYAKTIVTFKKLSKPFIKQYLDRVNPYDKAGAYAIQEGPKIVKDYDGSYSNVVGLPIELLKMMLKKLAL